MLTFLIVLSLVSVILLRSSFSISISTIVGGVLILSLVYCVIDNIYTNLQLYWNSKKIKTKQEEILRRKAILEDSLLVEGALLTPAREKISSTPIQELLYDLREAILTPVQVLEAFQAKALHVDKEINAVCDFIESARAWAVELETVPESERKSLYGLPVSVKECFYVAGHDSTIGLTQYIGDPAVCDSSFVRALKELQAVPFCLTNVPQTMISFGCSNPVYGITANPHQPTRTPGGSSGGEAALLAAGGSVLGLGSDVGGSLRVPAHFSGVCGLKPTNGRLYEEGRRGGPGANMSSLRCGLYSVAGFMSRDVAGLKVGMKSVLESSRKMSARDWRVAPVEWDESLYRPGRRLRLAYYQDNEAFPATPAVERALREVVSLLRAAGHHVEPWTPMDISKGFSLFFDFLLADKGSEFMKKMKFEKIDQSVRISHKTFSIPVPVRELLSHFAGLYSKKIKTFLQSGASSSTELWAKNAEKDSLIYRMMKEWEEKEFDAVITSPFPVPAVPHHYASSLGAGGCYTAVYNLTGCPAGVLPVTKVNLLDEAALKDYPAHKDLINKIARDATRGAVGCPVGVQVVGRHFQEEMVLHVMEVIETLVKNVSPLYN